VNVLVDTNVVSELKRGRNADSRVLAWFSQMPNEQIFTSVIVLGEVRRGIELMARRDKPQSELLERWYSSVREQLANRVLAVDEAVMTVWSRISVPDPLPAYDGLIAATALVHGMTIATRNATDYRRAGVAVFDPWADAPPARS
jgi:predicted nucleic acid-binding protein